MDSLNKFVDMKSFITTVLFFLLAAVANAQSVITLEECYDGAEANYPMVRQRDLIEKTKALSVENAIKGNLPQISVGGQGTYQSEVTQIPIEMPGVEPLSKDQYRVFGEISQTLYQGGLVDEKRRNAEISADVEHQELEVEIYQLRTRINDLFFGILLLQEQGRQSDLIKRDLHAGLGKTEAAISNGTAIRSAADVLRAELLKVDQRSIEMKAAENVYREMLGQFIGREVTHSVLQTPEFDTSPPKADRPELALFDLQRKRIQSNQALLSANKKPRLQLFVQGGYGRPGLNMLENEFEFYYLGGLRFSWPVSGYYTYRREKEIFTLRQQSLDVQKETFLFNTGLILNQHEGEIEKLRRLIQVDNQIIDLRTRIRQTAEVQLEEGVISSSDYVREVNAEDQAKQNRVLHETQLLMAQARYHFTSGQQ